MYLHFKHCRHKKQQHSKYLTFVAVVVMSILTVGTGEPHSADGEKYPLRTYLSSKLFKGVCNKGPGAQVSSGPASVIIFPCWVTNECRMMWVILSVTFFMLFKIMIQKNTADKTVHRRVHSGFLSVWVHVLQFDIWFCQAQVTIQLSKSHKRNISKCKVCKERANLVLLTYSDLI